MSKKIIFAIDKNFNLESAPCSRFFYISQELKKSGFKSYFFAKSNSNDTEPNNIKIKTSNIKNKNSFFKMISRIMITISVLKFMSSNNTTGIIVRGFWLGLFLVPFAKFFNVKFGFDFHGFSYIEQSKRGANFKSFYSKIIEIIIISNFDFVVTQNYFNYLSLQKYNKNIIFLDNGVDLKVFTNHKKQASSSPIFFVGFVAGNFGSWIDVHALFSSSNHFNKNIKLIVVGPLSSEMIEASKNYPNVIVTGKVPYFEVSKILGKVSLCIYPISDKYLNPFHGSPRKIKEWIAMGIPAVVSNFKPRPRYLMPNINVLISDGDSEYSLSQNVNYLSQNKNLLAKLEKNNIIIREKISWPSVVRRSNLGTFLNE